VEDVALEFFFFEQVLVSQHLRRRSEWWNEVMECSEVKKFCNIEARTYSFNFFP